MSDVFKKVKEIFSLRKISVLKNEEKFEEWKHSDDDGDDFEDDDDGFDDGDDFDDVGDDDDGDEDEEGEEFESEEDGGIDEEDDGFDDCSTDEEDEDDDDGFDDGDDWKEEDEYPNMWDDWEDDDDYWTGIGSGFYSNRNSNRSYDKPIEVEIKPSFEDALLYRFYSTLLGSMKFNMDRKSKEELTKDQIEIINELDYFKEKYPNNLFIPSEYIDNVSESTYTKNFIINVKDNIIDINKFKLVSVDNYEDCIPEDYIDDIETTLGFERVLLIYSEESVGYLKAAFDHYVDGEDSIINDIQALVLEKIDNGYLVITGW